ncbi:CAMK family protein kinase [Tritrichomonas foetus]|uniref:CAMK family protein kinase n=1 Tax=Tritrichomonas foetus TaxID=1144522 RepID=A0A1J4JKL7_9EUKA|nr:CAMK family protein kinase [Tritrichomonas foetus]|eukprot:OHS98943.1 CAMK family protein kinase [Tritrichomonas foetus]
MSRRKSPYNNTDEVFAAVAAKVRSASDSKVVQVEQNPDEEEESGEELVSQTLSHPIPSSIGQYEIRGTVGEGAFSVVRLAYSPKTKQYYACKVIERLRLKHNDLENRFQSEIRVHQQMHHPGIVQLIDILNDEHFYYVLVEFCPGGELFQHIVDSGKLQEEQAKPILKQILEAVQYIHKMGVSHRDLKPENLLLDEFGHTKISDFGLSRFLDPNGLAATPCGSPCYASPECISGNPYDGRTSDCWSVGVILYAMVTGQLPWTKRNQTQLFEQIRRGEYVIPGYLSGMCRNMISSLMCVNNKKRLTAEQALQHPFLSGVVVPLENMLENVFPLVSLQKVDRFFGENEEDVKVVIKRSINTTEKLEFDTALKIIKVTKTSQSRRKDLPPKPPSPVAKRRPPTSASKKTSTQTRKVIHSSTNVSTSKVSPPRPRVKTSLLPPRPSLRK